MSHASCRLGKAETSSESLPPELLALRQRVLAQPREIRAELETAVEEAIEHARFRDRVLNVARGALQQLKLDLELTRFDLDATRREREELLKQLEGRIGDELDG